MSTKNFTTSLGQGVKIKGKNMSQIESIQKQEQKILENEDMREWTKEEAEEWLEDNDFNTGDYDKMANFHAFTQNDADKYDDIRTETAPFGFDEDDGVHALYGIFDDDRGSEVQSIRFYHGED